MSEPVASSGKGMKLHTKILLGLVVGLAFGLSVNLTVGTENPVVEMVNDFVAVPIGQIFLRMLFMVVMPLVFGWAVQVLVGAWSHLLPAVAVTDPGRRAAMRSTLGRLAVPRLVAWNVGVLVAWIGLGLEVMPVALLGVAAMSLAALASVALVAISLGVRRS